MEQYWENWTYYLYIAKPNCVEHMKNSHGISNKNLQWFNTPKKHFMDQIEDLWKIGVMLFFTWLDQTINDKIHGNSDMLDTKYDTVVFSKKYRSNLYYYFKSSDLIHF